MQIRTKDLVVDVSIINKKKNSKCTTAAAAGTWCFTKSIQNDII